MNAFPPLPPEPVTPEPAEPEPVISDSEAESSESPSPRQFGRAAPRMRRTSRRMARLAMYLASLVVTGLVLTAIAVIVVFHMYSEGLPDSGKLAKYQPAGMTRLYAADGSLMAEYAKERRIFVPFRLIPPKVVQAFVAAEDQNFYTHRGVDPMGILRAFVANLRNYSTGAHSLVGGSTITQQVVKNFLLTREKSYDRKIKEAILAMRITQTYSKEKILELYLNEIYLGMGAYGVAAASDEYFGKDLSELSTEEVALLAAMPKAPAYYDPRKRPDEALQRRNYVLGRMEEDGYINSAEYSRALATPLNLVEPHEAATSATPFYSEEVRRWLLAKYGEESLYKGNLFVKTSVNPEVQAMVDKALRHALTAYDRRHGYRGALAHLESLNGWQDALSLLTRDTPLYEKQRLAVVNGVEAQKASIRFFPETTGSENGEGDTKEASIPFEAMKWARRTLTAGGLGAAPKRASDVLKAGDVVVVSPYGESGTDWALEQIPEVSGAMVAMRPQTGEVLAMSGGYSFGRSQFNRATQANRQPGSAFKPFVYLAGMERGFTPSSIVLDAPIELPQGAGLPPWRPVNYGGQYLGAAPLRMGLEKSHNAMTVRLAQMLGIHAIQSVAQRFGIYPQPARNFSIALGSYETTVLRLVTAYAMLANGGLKVEPVLVKRIDDRAGTTIYRADTRPCEGCNALALGGLQSGNTPPQPADNRERVVDPRIAYQMEQLLEGVVQRGTATKAKILGFPVAGKTGTTNDSRDAWFVGFTPEIVVGTYLGYDTPRNMGKKETGGAVALPAFIEFMQAYYKDREPPAVIKPDGILQMQVDRYSGVPALPWQAGTGSLITETFVTGGPIFIPGEEMKVAEPNDEPASQDGKDQFVDYDYGNQAYRSQTLGPDGQIYAPGPEGEQPSPAGSLPSNGLPPSYHPSTAYTLGGTPPGGTTPGAAPIPPQNGGFVPVQPPTNSYDQRRPVPQPYSGNNLAGRPAYQQPGDWQNLPPHHPARLLEERRHRTYQPSGEAGSGTGGLY